MTTELPAHLMPQYSDRGFARLPAIDGGPGETVRVYESSAALSPHLWLQLDVPTNRNDPFGEHHAVPIHLTVEAARQLAEQIQHLAANHYQESGS